MMPNAKDFILVNSIHLLNKTKYKLTKKFKTS